MCICFIQTFLKGPVKFILLSNRDEWSSRLATPPKDFPFGSEIYAGKDLKAGGTWFAIKKDGTFAVITNFDRTAKLDAAIVLISFLVVFLFAVLTNLGLNIIVSLLTSIVISVIASRKLFGVTAVLSRGDLPLDFVQNYDNSNAEEILTSLTKRNCRGFNLIAGNGFSGEIHYSTNSNKRNGQRCGALLTWLDMLIKAALKVLLLSSAMRDDENNSTGRVLEAQKLALECLRKKYGHHDTTYCLSSSSQPIEVQSSVGNGYLDDDVGWHKIKLGKQLLSKVLEEHAQLFHSLTKKDSILPIIHSLASCCLKTVLSNTQTSNHLPPTGYPREMEEPLTSINIIPHRVVVSSSGWLSKLQSWFVEAGATQEDANDEKRKVTRTKDTFGTQTKIVVIGYEVDGESKLYVLEQGSNDDVHVIDHWD